MGFAVVTRWSVCRKIDGSADSSLAGSSPRNQTPLPGQVDKMGFDDESEPDVTGWQRTVSEERKLMEMLDKALEGDRMRVQVAKPYMR